MKAPELIGAQRPRICSIPPSVSSSGEEALEVVEMAGLVLDPWEEFTLVESLAERPDGNWAAFEVGVLGPRQNGKNEILSARQLVGLFLLEEPLQTHSAHRGDTSLEALDRLENLIESCPDFDRRVQRVSRTHGEEGIKLKDGQRIRFRTRSGGGGKGFTGDVVYFDEAWNLSEMFHGNLLPTLSARSVTGNPQVWYTSSAVDQWIHENGVVLARIRERGIAGGDDSLLYVEWSVPGDNPDNVEAPEDPEGWAQANPALGIRISVEHVAREMRSMDPRTFAVERLGVGDWPRTDGLATQVIGDETWARLADRHSSALDPVCFAFDVAPDRSSASIGVAGPREDERGHIEVIDRRRGATWVVSRVAELVERHEAVAVLCDGAGPAASLIFPLEQLLDFEVTAVTAQEYAQACGLFVDSSEDGSLRHLEDAEHRAELTAAVRGAAQRPLGDGAWAWSRKSSNVDISPLVACTLAHWGSVTAAPPPEPLVAVR